MGRRFESYCRSQFRPIHDRAPDPRYFGKRPYFRERLTPHRTSGNPCRDESSPQVARAASNENVFAARWSAACTTGKTLSSIHITKELRDFLTGRLTSADQIEIVLLLQGSPTQSWTAPEVSKALSMAPESTAMRLFLLASQGLILFEPSGVPRYRYGGGDATTARLLQELASNYASNRADVLRVIGAPAVDPIQSFADAFKLKK